MQKEAAMDLLLLADFVIAREDHGSSSGWNTNAPEGVEPYEAVVSTGLLKWYHRVIVAS